MVGSQPNNSVFYLIQSCQAARRPDMWRVWRRGVDFAPARVHIDAFDRFPLVTLSRSGKQGSMTGRSTWILSVIRVNRRDWSRHPLMSDECAQPRLWTGKEWLHPFLLRLQETDKRHSSYLLCLMAKENSSPFGFPLWLCFLPCGLVFADI